MTTPLVGQPCRATVTFRNEDGVLTSAARVDMVEIGPHAAGIVKVVGTDPEATQVEGVEGTYRLAFTPTELGPWTVWGRAYNAEGKQIGSASAAINVGAPGLLADQDSAAVTALALVEDELNRPLALIENDAADYFTGPDGVVELFMRPVVAVSEIVTVDGGVLLSLWTLIGNRIFDLPAYTWVRVTSDHGWPEGEVPRPVVAVLESCAARLRANAATGGGVVRETIGGYSVEYEKGASGLALTDDEKRLLGRYACRPPRATTLSTRTERSPLLPYLDVEAVKTP